MGDWTLWIDLDNLGYETETTANYNFLRDKAVHRVAEAQIELIAATEALKLIDKSMITKEVRRRFGNRWDWEGKKALYDYSDEKAKPVFVGNVINGRLRVYYTTSKGKPSKTMWDNLTYAQIIAGNLRPKEVTN